MSFIRTIAILGTVRTLAAATSAPRAGTCPYAPRLDVWRTSRPTGNAPTLRGALRDSAGRPIAGARVDLDRAVAAITDREGAFRLVVPRRALRADGPMTLYAEAVGYDAQMLHLYLAPGDSVIARVELCPESPDHADRERDALDRPPAAALDTADAVWHVASPGATRRPVARLPRPAALALAARFAGQWRALQAVRRDAVLFPACAAGSAQVRRIGSRSARPGGLVVRGQVHDVDGTPLPHANLFAREMGSPFGADADGRFSFSPPIGWGWYHDSLTIEAGAESHLSRAQRVEFWSGDTLDVDIALCRGTAPPAAPEPVVAPVHREPASGRRLVHRIGRYDVALAGDTLTSVARRSRRARARLAVFDPARTPSGWGASHDTLLVIDRRLVAVRYGHARGPVRIAVIDVDVAGRLRRRAAYTLSGERPWPTGRNEVARLVGRTLVVYAEKEWPLDGSDADVRPTLRRLGPDGHLAATVPTTTTWYAMAQPLGAGPTYGVHTVTSCPVTRRVDEPIRTCWARVVPAGTAMNVLLSRSGVELWADGRPAWARFDIPYRGAAPSVVAAPEADGAR